jgi:hypothetical protein
VKLKVKCTVYTKGSIKEERVLMDKYVFLCCGRGKRIDKKWGIMVLRPKYKPPAVDDILIIL